jgi:hypothetical protein
MKTFEATEQWLPVHGYEGLYSVSNYGRVKREKSKRWAGVCGVVDVSEKILTPTNTKGYKFVGLSKDGKTKRMPVHRIVAIAFIPNPKSLPMVNHKDESRDNNHADNLEWCTGKYNSNYGTVRKRLSEKAKTSQKHIAQFNSIKKDRSRAVLCVETGTRYDSLSAAQKETGISHQNICGVCQGKRTKAGGYTWIYTK